jgi:NAD(P)H-hydrate epimerase
VRSRLPARPRDAHKDTFGRVLIVAGSLNYTGAAVLAGEGAYRAGAGLVTLGVPGLLHAALAGRLPEATFLLLPHDQGALRQDAADVLRKELGPYRALLVGPGLGQDDATAAFVEALFTGRAGGRRGRMGFVHRDSGEPGETGSRRARFGFAPGGAEAAPADAEEAHAMPALVVDADGLNLLARLDDWARRLAPGTVLTPHPGEMARLLKMEPAAVQADRLGTAERAAREWGHVVVLKGAYTVVAAPDGRVRIAPWARAGLARAGSGDVLAGAIAALLAQGLEPFDAAACGVYLHGLAGALAETELGAAGVLAGGIAEFMGDAVALVAGE